MKVDGAERICPSELRRLAEDGCSMLFLDVPQGTVVGLDFQRFQVGPQFRGWKMVPPGVHMVSFNSVSATDFAPTVSFFVDMKPREVLVRRWDKRAETLEKLEDEAEDQRLVEGVRRFDFDGGLAPFTRDAFQRWQQLAGHITPDVIDKISPVGGCISIIAEGAMEGLENPKTQAERNLRDQLQERKDATAKSSTTKTETPTNRDERLAGVSGNGDGRRDSPDERPGSQSDLSALGEESRDDGQGSAGRGGRCFYTHIPRHASAKRLSPAQITAENMDKTLLLQQVVQQQYWGQWQPLLGELQFAFLAFVVGQSLDGFLQWKRICHLLLTCVEAPLSTAPDFFASALDALRYQIMASCGEENAAGVQAGPYAGESQAFGLDLTCELWEGSFLKGLLKSFFQLMDESTAELTPALNAAQQRLRCTVEYKLRWPMSSIVELQTAAEGHGMGDDDEYAPVVVEL